MPLPREGMGCGQAPFLRGKGGGDRVAPPGEGGVGRGWLIPLPWEGLGWAKGACGTRPWGKRPGGPDIDPARGGKRGRRSQSIPTPHGRKRVGPRRWTPQDSRGREGPQRESGGPAPMIGGMGVERGPGLPQRGERSKESCLLLVFLPPQRHPKKGVKERKGVEGGGKTLGGTIARPVSAFRRAKGAAGPPCRARNRGGRFRTGASATARQAGWLRVARPRPRRRASGGKAGRFRGFV